MRARTFASIGVTALFVRCTFDLPRPGPKSGALLCAFDAGDSAAQHANSLAGDGTGELAVGGLFKGTMDFGVAQLVNPDDDFMTFVARLDSSCGARWARAFTGPYSVQLTAVAMDTEHVWCAGFFTETITGLALSAPPGEGHDGFFVELDAQGQPLNQIHIGGDGRQEPQAIARAGDAWLVAGSFQTELRAATPVMATGLHDAFMVWVAGATLGEGWSYGDVSGYNLASQVIQDIEIDRDGNVVVAGDFSRTIDFGSNCEIVGTDAMAPPTPNPENDVFVAKLTPQGGCLWARHFGSTGDDEARGIAIDETNSVLVVGSFKATVAFDAFTLSAPDEHHNAFVAKLDATGSVLWADSFGATGEQHGSDVAVDAETGHAIVSMDVDVGVDFDPEAEGGDVATAATDVVLVALDPQGVFVWARAYGDGGNQYPRAVVADALGYAVTGTFGGALGEGDVLITGDSLNDAFVLRVQRP